MAVDDNKPVVHILATGGTIAGSAPSPLQTAGYKAGMLSVSELTESIPGLDKLADIRGEQFCNIGSSALTIEQWLGMARRINEIFATQPEVAGIVVTHGTDTLEETAYFLNLVIKSSKPVVVVGAMRPASAISSDGPMNLLNAVCLAASPAARDMGVLVVLNDEIHAAREVTKSHANQLHTFRSPDFGALGTMNNGTANFYRRPLRQHTCETEFEVSRFANLPRVDIVYSHIGADRTAIEAFTAVGAQGIVLAGTGAGSTTPDIWEALDEVSQKGVRVVRSSRTGGGKLLSAPPLMMDANSTISADNLNPHKARVLLMLALTRTNDAREIQRMFLEY